VLLARSSSGNAALQRLSMPRGPRPWLRSTSICRSSTGFPAVDRKGVFVACGTKHPEAKVFDFTKGTLVTTIKFEGEPPYDSRRAMGAHAWAEGLRFTPDGEGLLVPVGHDGASPVADPHTRLYRIPSGELIEDLGRAIVLGEASEGRVLLIDPYKQELITVAAAPSVHRVRLDLPDGTLAPQDTHEAYTIKWTAAVARDANLVALASRERLYLVSTADGRTMPLDGAPRGPSHDDSPTLAYMKSFFSADGRLLFGMVRGQGASAWETAHGRLVFVARHEVERLAPPAGIRP
jgi:hypothetical protein